MSRCFPFPPSGYIGIRDEAVIKSIKGTEEKKSKKEERSKERKREKKRKEREGKEGESKKNRKRQRKEEGTKDIKNQKVVKENENESLEKSSLTIERDLLQTTSQNSCDSTHNSNELPKQQKEKQSLDDRHKQPFNRYELPKEQKEKQSLDGRHKQSLDGRHKQSLNSNELLPKQQKEKQPLDGRHKQPLNSNELLPKQQKEKQPFDGRHKQSLDGRHKQPLNSNELPKQQPLDGRHKQSLNSNELLPKQQKEKQSLDGRHKQPLNSNELLPKQQKEKQSLDGRHNQSLNSNELLPKQQPLDGRHNNDSESIIRIQLPLTRQKDPKVMLMTNKDQQKLDSSCSTSASEHASKPNKDTKLCKKKFSTGLCSLCPPSLAMQFMNVVENWVPNTIERTNSEDEDCWWLSKKPKFDTERFKDKEIIKQVNNSMAWPCVCLLPEADVYSLPYTVPF